MYTSRYIHKHDQSKDSNLRFDVREKNQSERKF